MQLILGLSLILFAADPAQTFNARVVHVADGDTLTVLTQDNVEHKIRLLGIDAPERGRGKQNPGQPYSARSQERLEQLVKGKGVSVTWKERDRYGRILGDVYVGDTWINRQLVDEGLAWHYRQFDRRQELSEAERQAREGRRGLWSDREPVPPWEWRKSKREAAEKR